MARLASPRAKSKPRLEIIPFIDIMFFLLATFMMVSLSMIQNEGIPIHLPKASSSSPQERVEQISLTVTQDGKLFWNKQEIPFESLPERLHTLKEVEKDPRIFINADEEAFFGKTVKVLDAVRVSGITKVAIETQKTNPNHP